jgi:hydrogenase nickel incorporation protein HypB
MDAYMTEQGIDKLGMEDVDVVFLENVGNLVCPAEFDTGAVLNVVILSITEGDDKPLKYPLVFEQCDAVIINKIDALPVFDFDFDKARANIALRNDHATVFPISAKTTEGVDKLADWIVEKVQEWQGK